MNVDCIEIPDGYTLLEAVVLAKCLDENGDMIITEHRSSANHSSPHPKTDEGQLVPAHKRSHYTGNYQARARAVRNAAAANLSTRCAMCGLTLDQHPLTRTGKRQTWDADHEQPGVPTSRLRPVAASCNRSAGATLGNTQRNATSRRW